MHLVESVGHIILRCRRAISFARQICSIFILLTRDLLRRRRNAESIAWEKSLRMSRSAAQMNRSKGASLRLLVVEDHVDSAEMLSRMLANFGYHVRTANSAAGAREIFASEAFDVMLSDLGLPDESGYDLMS